MTVFPDGVGNQAVGSLVQGASRALQEEVAFNTRRVTSLDWVTYPGRGAVLKAAGTV